MYDFSEVNENRKQEKIEHLKKMQDVLLELRNMGLGYRQMAKRLNELGYRTCTGKTYTYATVFDDLKSIALPGAEPHTVRNV